MAQWDNSEEYSKCNLIQTAPCRNYTTRKGQQSAKRPTPQTPHTANNDRAASEDPNRAIKGSEKGSGPPKPNMRGGAV